MSSVSQVKPVAERPKLQKILKDPSGIIKQNGIISTTTSTPAPSQSPATNGEAPSPDTKSMTSIQLPEDSSSLPRERAQTLSELKKQRSAAKLLNHPLLNGHLGNGSTESTEPQSPVDSRMPLVSSNGSTVYYTPASGDPPILKLKQPIDDEEPKEGSCCCVS